MNERNHEKGIWYSGIPTTNGIKYEYKEETKRATKDKKGYLRFALIAAILSDVAILGCLLAMITDFKYFFAPLFLLVADVTFFITTFFVNFRYGYATKYGWIYAAFSVALLLVAEIMPSMEEQNLVMAIGGNITLAVGQIIKLVAVVATFVMARKPASKKNKSGLGVVAVAACLLALCVFFNFNNGYMGQGNRVGGRVCTLVYGTTENGEYVIKKVIGKGDTVVIPDKFKGKNVTGMNCELLNDRGIKKIVVESANKQFFNIDKIEKFNVGLEIVADKKIYDSIRTAVFKAAYDGSSGKAMDLLKAMKPQGLGSDETYYNVFYGVNLPTGELAYIPTLVVKKTDSVSDALKNALRNVKADYIDVDHIESSSQSDLKWCYDNTDGYMLDLKNAQISEGSVVVKFDSVHFIDMLDGNDEKFVLDESWNEEGIPAFAEAGKYVAGNDAVKFFEETLPKRDGFACEWYANENGGDVTKTKIASGAELSTALNGTFGKSVCSVRPKWTVIPPEIEGITSDEKEISSDMPLTLTYGEDAKIAVAARSALGEDMITYALLKDGKEIASNRTGEFELVKYVPDQSGEYCVSAVCEDDKKEITSLSSIETKKAFRFVINKKKMSFTWTVPSGEYNGAKRTVSAAHDASKVVKGDSFLFETIPASVKDAGVYYPQVKLSEATASKYDIDKSGVTTVEIEKKKITPVWNVATAYVYNGQTQHPTATAQGVPGEGVIEFSVTGAGAKAGTYTAVLHIKSKYDNGKQYSDNYVIEKNGSLEYAIEKRIVAVTGWENDLLTYNGAAQLHRVAATNGHVSGEEEVVKGDFIYTFVSGAKSAVNRGEYSVKATLKESSDYKFAVGEEYEHKFTINPRSITARTWNANVFTYNGKKQRPRVLTLEGCVNGEAQKVIDEEIVYTDGNAEKGKYTVRATLSSPETSNYALDSAQEYVINPLKAELTWTLEDEDLVYAGKSKKVTVTVTNLQTDEEGNKDVCTVNTHTQGDNKNAGTFGIIAKTLSSDNYILPSDNPTQTFEITKKTLFVSTKDHTMTYGSAMTENNYEVNGFVGNDTEANTVFTVTYPREYGTRPAVKEGGYPIKIVVRLGDSVARNNYEIVYTYGTLTVNPKPILLDWSLPSGDATVNESVYDGKAQLPKAVPSAENGTVGADVCEVFVELYVGDNKNVTSDGYKFRAVGVSNGNYRLSTDEDKTISQAFYIKKRDLTFGAKAHTVTYGDEIDGAFGGYEASGFADGESVESLKIRVELKTDYVLFGDVGEYTIEFDESKTSSPNYTPVFRSAVLSVVQRQIEFEWKPNYLDLTYDAEAKTLAPIIANRVNDDDVSFEYALILGTSGAATDNVNVTSEGFAYEVTSIKGGKRGNYAMPENTVGSRNYIQKRALRVDEVAVNAKTYDGNDVATVSKLTVSGIIGNEIEVVATAKFDSADAGTNKNVLVKYALQSNGGKTSNYSIRRESLVKGTVKPRGITINEIIIEDKVYDGTTDASYLSLDTSGILDGEVSVAVTARFNDKHVGTNKRVDIEYSLEAAKINGKTENYTITPTGNAQASVTPKTITVKSYDSTSFIYNGEERRPTVTAFEGVLEGDESYVYENVVYSQGGRYVSIQNLTVTLKGGCDYAFDGEVSVGYEILRKPLTVKSVKVADKVYDRETAVSVTELIVEGIVNGEITVKATAAFLTADAGRNKEVTVKYELEPSLSEAVKNYTAPSETKLQANVLARTITIKEVKVSDKTYDGLVTATVTKLVTEGILTGEDGSDEVTVNATAAFENADAGTNKKVIVKYSLSALSGKTENYAVPENSISAANIKAKKISVTDVKADDKVYDGSVKASVSALTTEGILNEEVKVVCEAKFSDANAGKNKKVLVTYALSAVNGKVANYVAPISGETTAEITAKEAETHWIIGEFVYNGANQADRVQAYYADVNGSRIYLATDLSDFVDYKEGGYTVRATLKNGETNYVLEETSRTTTVNISKADNAISDFAITGWTEGEESSVPVAKAKFGTVRFVYSSAKNGAYGDIKPTVAGTYYCKAVVNGCENYDGAESEAIEFVIAPKQTSDNEEEM